MHLRDCKRQVRARWEILGWQNSAGLPEKEEPPNSQQKVVVESKVCLT